MAATALHGLRATHPLRSAVPRAGVQRVGLLGLGAVGQAVARLCADAADALPGHSPRLAVTAALVRDPARPRAYLPPGACVTADPDAFCRGRYDVVIESLVGVEPAATLVARLLAAGVPVVTANKALVAARGPELRCIARRDGAALLCEATVIAGLPFLTLLNRRPLAARVQRLTGIVNATTNFVLSAMAHERLGLAAAVRAAQERGLAEPDPARDLAGRDAAEKLVILLQHLGAGGARPEDLEVTGIEELTPADLEQARALGGTVKPIVHAELTDEGVAAFSGPAFVPAGNPLAALEREQNGVRLWGPRIGTLVYSGPGAGPEVTAGTLLDDALEVLQRGAGGAAWQPPAGRSCAAALRAPETPWLLCLSFDGGAPPRTELAEFLAAQGVWFSRTGAFVRRAAGESLYALAHAAPRERIAAALAALHAATGCTGRALRALED